MKSIRKFINTYSSELFIIFFGFLFSLWLGFHTFYYANGTMFIGVKAWSDFASHIPLIRSFSLGSNFPPQYPLFAGEPIHYHFLFYALVGILEQIGVRIDFALNSLFALGFTGLLIMLYVFAKKLFSNVWVGALSVLFFLFNGTFSFAYFFIKHPLSKNSIADILTNKTFPSFGPYDPGIVSAFWNLNIYTNQRHLAAAFALSLLTIYVFLKPIYIPHKHKLSIVTSVVLGIVLGCMFYFHLAVLLMTVTTLFMLMIFFKQVRISGFIIFFTAGLICLPQYLYLASGGPSFKLLFNPGYLISGNNFSIIEFNRYWVMNLGLHYFLIPIGFFLTSGRNRKIFLAFFASFIVGSLFQFSPDMAGNHKFFNYFMLVGTMFSAYTLVRIWNIQRVSRFISRPVVTIAIFFMILSGIIDFFPIYNDSKMALADYQKNQDIAWIMNNTPPNAIFLNTQYLYTPESLAGRKIFLGWPYFSWSAGYNTEKRSKDIKIVLTSNNKRVICSFLNQNNISYITLTQTSEDFPYDQKFFDANFKPSYRNSRSNLKIYKTMAICGNKKI